MYVDVVGKQSLDTFAHTGICLAAEMPDKVNQRSLPHYYLRSVYG
jgi:hypothetical protein